TVPASSPRARAPKLSSRSISVEAAPDTPRASSTSVSTRRTAVSRGCENRSATSGAAKNAATYITTALTRKNACAVAAERSTSVRRWMIANESPESWSVPSATMKTPASATTPKSAGVRRCARRAVTPKVTTWLPPKLSASQADPRTSLRSRSLMRAPGAGEAGAAAARRSLRRACGSRADAASRGGVAELGVVGAEARGLPPPREPLGHDPTALAAEPARERRVEAELRERVGERRLVARSDQPAVHPVGHDLGRAPVRRDDRRHAAGERLDDRQAERLRVGRRHHERAGEHVGGGEVVVVDAVDEDDAVAERLRERRDLRRVPALAQAQLAPRRPAPRRDDLEVAVVHAEQDVDPLLGRERADVEDDGAAVQPPARAQLLRQLPQARRLLLGRSEPL